jgi:type I restriction enzyme R subunit
MTSEHKEIAFEKAIEESLVTTGGYLSVDRSKYDPVRGLFPEEVIAFIRETQPKEWQYLESIQKRSARETLLDDLCRALDSQHEGSLSVLRRGFKCFGKLFRVACFAPASGLNPEILRLYNANRLAITRQLKYSPHHNNTLDVTLSLNGIPIATLELKNQMTGQTVRDAIVQYKEDRDPNDLIFQFRKRSLVHFAVDTDRAYMTTRLSGKSTHFLPFNRGNNGGEGNPENPAGYRTSYLWEEVLERHSILDIIGRFVHLQTEEVRTEDRTIRKETMIFPRYHQLDCVRRIVHDARDKGAGTNYLVQHSAGSGKSNSIAWLAYRLSSLHDEEDRKVFDSVVVVTDRVVLDKQLQDTIYQFDHKEGVVRKIDKDSAQLAEALTSGVPIIITTLQKFPFVTEKIDALPARRYAVIVDEAHSSQGGETATELKGVLGGAALKEEARRRAEEESLPDYEEEILKSMAKRGRQPNISFFAFTATPKYKTLEVFGLFGPDGKPRPFHLYTMRQAIEENFILDVLKNYISYRSYYKLVKSIEDDPEVSKRRAAKALARYMTLHPHNIAQKTTLMIEHFRQHGIHKIGGKAKAMVVTSSRLHAVRYKQAFDKYLKENGYNDIKALVAFSGTVADPDLPGVEYTEPRMNNGISEKQLPEKFSTGEYRVLLVAEKYQTGFDQPLLHTMYVDKRLDGIQAVQTLSRLNRIHPGKEETFVLDFVNDPEDIQKAFQPYYEQTLVGEQVEVGQLYELQARIDQYKVIFRSDIEAFCKVFFKPRATQSAADHAAMNACLDPVVERFRLRSDEEKEDIKNTLTAFRSLYAFMSQIIPFQDTDLEKLYTFIRFLIPKLPLIGKEPTLNLNEEVALKYYRLQKISEESIKLDPGSGEISGPTEVGTQTMKEAEIRLSKLIDVLNERFGTDFKPGDQLFFESIREDALLDSSLQQAAMANNTIENFGYAFNRALEDLVVSRMEQNGEISAKFFNDREFRDIVSQKLMREVFDQIRETQEVGA